MRMHRVTAAIVGVALALWIGIAQAHDEKGIPSKGEKLDAKLSLSGMSAAIGVGTTWGSGTLTYKPKAHPVWLRGLEIGGVGRARIEAHGEVYHLSNLADSDGTYVAIGAGAAAGQGAGGFRILCAIAGFAGRKLIRRPPARRAEAQASV